MQEDFHYYATYCAAYIAGYTHEECMAICYSAQFVDVCTRTYLSGLKAPVSAATTQLQLELADARMDILGVQDMTRIWSSFHFLPRDLYAEPDKKRCGKKYKNKYRLICGPNGELLASTVRLAKGRSLQAAGIAMHVLADTWAHQYFAGTPSLAINNTNDYFYELISENGDVREVPVKFIHSTSRPDQPEISTYTNSIYQSNERSIMNLGHGRAGHLPDYSYVRYKYLPAWGNYNEIIKDNPLDYAHAFTQMIYALKYLRGEYGGFETDRYDTDAVQPWKEEIMSIILRRQTDASADWKALGERLSGCEIEDFDIDRYRDEYLSAESDSARHNTFLGKFIIAAMAQKSMVTHEIYESGNSLAGYSIDYSNKGFRGIRDFAVLVVHHKDRQIEDAIEDAGSAIDEAADKLGDLGL